MSDPIAIAGGGIGGLTLAIALRRKGLESVVLERESAFRSVGAGITMQLNAMTALRHIGADEAVRAAGNRLDRLKLLWKTGTVMATTEMAEYAAEFDASFTSIHRERLHDALLQLLPSEIVRLGFEVERFSETDRGVLVTSTNHQQIEAAALVGADGLRSRVRTQLWGEHPLRYSGCTSWRGVLENDGFVCTTDGSESWGDRSIFGLIPLAEKRLYWFGTETTQPGGIDPEDPRDALLKLFGDWHDPIPRVIQATPPQSILRTDIYDRPFRFPWGRDRVTLLGDAAHPMTPNMGQGGGQAVEDAVVLAELLANSDSIESGFRAYQKARHERTKKFVNTSRRVTRLVHGMNFPLRIARAWFTTLVPSWVQEREFRNAFRFEIPASHNTH